MKRSATSRKVALATYVADRLRREAKEKGRGYAADVARKAGTSTAHLANVMNEKAGVGEDFATKLAEIVWPELRSYEGIKVAADAWFRENDGPTLRAVTADDEPTNLLEAEKQLGDRVTQKARQLARDSEYASGRDKSVEAWKFFLLQASMLLGDGGEVAADETAPKKRR